MQPETRFTTGFGAVGYCNPANGHQLDVSMPRQRDQNQTKKPKEEAENYLDRLKAKRLKLAAALKKDELFEGLVFYVNAVQLSDKGHSELSFRHLIQRHGGLISRSIDSTVTHLICSGLAAGKYRKLKAASGRGLEMVTADWVFACVESSKRVSEAPYRIIPKKEKGTLDSFWSKKKGSPGRVEKGKTEPRPRAELKIVDEGVIVIDD